MAQHAVLLVEDSADDRMFAASAFQKVAPHVRLSLAVNGEEAIRYLSGEGVYQDRDANPIPCLVLLDLKMPKVSGFEVLSWIRKESNLKQLPVMIWSSSQEPADVERASALGANSFMVKSVDLKGMRETVRGVGEYVSRLSRNPTPHGLPT
jgi:CheY-like chemotaxis protein